MSDDRSVTARELVAASTVAAAHRRDHAHQDGEPSCHPHRVEVIGLGRFAVAVCHDCRVDSGLLDERAAESMAALHRRQTVAGDVAMGSGSAA